MPVICLNDAPCRLTEAPKIAFRSNTEIPGLSESIKGNYEAAVGNLSTIEERIKRLETELDAWRVERNEHTQYLRRHKRLVSAVRRVPPEIWREIIVVRHEGHRESTRYDRNTLAIDAPCLFLGRVCRQFRNIIVGTCRLWSEVRTVSSFIDREGRLALLDLWLLRSGSHPINVSLSTAGSSGRENRFLELCLHSMINHAWHWKTACLDLSQKVLCSSLFPIVSAPLLEEIELGMRRLTNHNGATQLLIDGAASSLRGVRIENGFDSDTSLLGITSWASLLVLHLGGTLSAAQQISVLRNCPALTKLTWCVTTSPDVTQESSQIRLERLEYVHFGTEHDICDVIVAPSLKEMEFRRSIRRSRNGLTGLPSFIAHAAGLQKLSLFEGDSLQELSSSAAVDLVWPMKELCIEVQDDNDTEFSSFLYRYTEQLIEPGSQFPNLTTLVVYYYINDTPNHRYDRCITIRDSLWRLCTKRKSPSEHMSNSTPYLSLQVRVTIEDTENEFILERQAFENLGNVGFVGLEVVVDYDCF